METTVQAQTEAEAPVAEAPVEATPAEAPKAKATRSRKAAPKAQPKAQAKAKPRAKAQPIPEGMTRSRGQLIPKADGQCALASGDTRCKNPGRWPLTIQGVKVLTCTTHKKATKVALFQQPARKRSRSTKQAAAASA